MIKWVRLKVCFIFGPGKFNARHILIKTKGGPNGEQGLPDEDAKKKALALKAQFEGGAKWDEMSKQHSEDPGSKDKGGLYEGIAYGQFVPEFEEAVKKQAIGKVGDPVKSSFGYHLIQVESRSDSDVPSFELAKEQVKQRAMQARQEQVWKGFVDGVKKEVDFVPADKDGNLPPAKAPAAKPAAKAPAAKAPATKKAAQ